MLSQTFVPTDKHDLASADAAVRAGFPAVESVLPELVVWLQDYNWPVARVLAPFLATIGLPMVPHIDTVLATDDDLWKYWMISCLIGENRSLFLHYESELNRMANHPTEHERQQELDDIAQDAIEKQNQSG